MNHSSPLSATRELTTTGTHQQIQQYYDIAGPDYETWSKNYNMHFGYCRRFSDLFSLEKMLVNMNELVMEQLRLPAQQPCHVADLGCGMGTVARHIATKKPNATFTAVTIAGFQIEQGNLLTAKQQLCHRVTIEYGDFEQLHYPAAHFTHAYAIESACHAAGSSKELFIAELARVLKNGGRFCIADGFLKTQQRRPRLFNWLSKRIARYWAVPGFANIDEFTAALHRHGLQQVEVKEISMRIAPSVLYVPLICIKFFFKEIIKNRSLRMKKERWHNVYAPLLGMLMGMYRKQFGYFLVSGRK